VSEAVQTLSLDEFLHLEQSAGPRHELVGGRTYAMAGGTERHELMKHAIYRRLADRAMSAGCRPFTGRMLHTPNGNVYYPDVLIVSGPAPHALHENDATMVVEVASPSTRTIDKREKVNAYAELPSIGMYLLVETEIRQIEVATWEGGRISWSAFGAGEVLASPYGVLAVDDLYDEVETLATT
jgi:Uma2 family endonuclease